MYNNTTHNLVCYFELWRLTRFQIFNAKSHLGFEAFLYPAICIPEALGQMADCSAFPQLDAIAQFLFIYQIYQICFLLFWIFVCLFYSFPRLAPMISKFGAVRFAEYGLVWPHDESYG